MKVRTIFLLIGVTIFVAILVSSGTTATIQGPTCAPTPANLISWYRAEGDANDQQGNNDGNLQNGAAFTAGKVGQAFSFDGIDDRFRITNAVPLSPLTNSFTVEAWIRTSQTTGEMYIVSSNGFAGNNTGLSLYTMYLSNGVLLGAIRDSNGGGPDVGGAHLVEGSGSLADGNFHHVLMTRNTATNMVSLYVDGTLNASEPFNAGSSGSVDELDDGEIDPFVIGGSTDTGVGVYCCFFSGVIDEVSLYSRVLTEAEITSIFNAGSAGKCLSIGCVASPANQVSWYRGENNANDSQGTNNGTLQNGAGFAPGKVGQAFSLDGTDDFVRVGNPTALNFGTGDFSIQAWVKTSFLGGTFSDYIISKSGVGNDAQFILSYNAGATGFPSFIMSDGTNTSSASGTTNLADGAFHHLAGVREGTTLRLYVDGQEVGTATTSTLVNASSANNVVIGGRDNPAFDPYFNGIIDEVQFFNRALSSAEIQSIFAADGAGVCNALQISPTTPSVTIGNQVDFNAALGTPPYTFGIETIPAHGTIDPVTGVYTALSEGTDTVRVTDAANNTSDATVTVTSDIACPSGQKVWDGGGVTENWSEAANWCNNSLPTSGEIVFFNGTSPKNAIVDNTISVQGLQINSGYTGTLSQAAGADISVGPNGFSQSAGTFQGGAGNITTGNIVISAGTFTAPSGTLTLNSSFTIGSGVTFDLDNGTIAFVGNGNVTFSIPSQVLLNNLTLDQPESLGVTINGNIVRVAGTLTLIEGIFISGTIKAENAVSIAPSFGWQASSANGSGLILIQDGAAPRTITLPAGVRLPHVRLNDPNVMMNASGTGTVTVLHFFLDEGAVDLGSNNFVIGLAGNGSYTQGGAVGSSGGTFSIGSGNVDLSGGAFTLRNGIFNAGSGNFNLGAENFTLTGGTFNAPSGTTTIGIDINRTFTQSGGTFNGNGTVEINNWFILSGGSFIAAPGNTLFGNIFDHQAGTFTHNNGTVVLDGNHPGYSINTNSSTVFNNLTINNLVASNATLGLGSDTWTINGTLHIINAFINDGLLRTNGNMIVENTADGGVAGITFGGTVNQTYTNNGGVNTTGTWTIDKPSGAVIAASSLILNTSQTLNITSGTLYLNGGSNLTSGPLSVELNGKLTSESATTITLGGNVTNNGIVDLQGGGAACPEPDSILIRSFDSTQRSWTGSGRHRLVDVDVRNMGGTGTKTVFSGTNSGGNNASWVFDNNCPTSLSISPEVTNLLSNQTTTYVVGGGFAPYTFSLFVNNSGGTINATTGLYTAGPTSNVSDTVRVTDAFGSTANATANVIGAPTRLAFIVQPTNTIAGQSITPGIQVAIQDSLGNTVTNENEPITISIGNNSAGSTLSGTVTREAVNGVATFNDLSLNRVGTNYTLVASAGSFTIATSNGFEIAHGSAHRMALVVQPSNTKRSAIIEPSIQVEVLDSLGNRVTNSVNSATLAIGDNPGGGLLSGELQQTFINGVATFSDARIVGGVGGTGYTLVASSAGLTSITSNSFNILGPAKLSFIGQPSNAKRGAIIAPPIQVQVQDANGNAVTDLEYSVLITLEFGTGVVTGGTSRQTVNGIATFDDLRITGGIGGHGFTLRASLPGDAGVLSAISTPFNIFGPTQLAFTVQPATAKRNIIISPAVQIQVQDENGVAVTDANYVIEVVLESGNGILLGTNSQTTFNGVATFHDLKIGGFGGHGFTLRASIIGAPGVASILSNPFNILGPAQLAFIVQPANTKRSAIISPAIQVQVRDENGDLLTDSDYSIDILLESGHGILQGHTSRTPINGVATFDDLRIVEGPGGQGFTLRALILGAPAAPHAISLPFNIFGPTQLAFIVQPSNVNRHEIITPAVQVEVRDENGSVVTDSEYLISVASENFPSGVLQGGTQQSSVNGIATFSDLRVAGGGGGHGFTLSASSPNFSPVTSSPFDVLAPPFEVTNANDSGTGSLRQAIINANNTPGVQTITFNLQAGPLLIKPLSRLPSISDPVIIDGTTQPGFVDKPIVELDGSLITGAAHGLSLIAGNSMVRGLVINSFPIGISLQFFGNNTIQGNYIGTNVAGTSPRGCQNGIYILASNNNLIGGTSPTARNLISGNNTGVNINANSSQNVIQGNYIGTDALGANPIPNIIGVHIDMHETFVAGGQNYVGGIQSGEGNIIAFNSWGGVRVDAQSTQKRNSIRGNSIHSNGLLGIDLPLDGVNFNDQEDGDTGANDLQNYPCVTAASSDGVQTRIRGNLDSHRSSTYQVDYYSSPTCDASGWGEGKTYLGSTELTTPAHDIAYFDITLPVASTIGHFITSTATDSEGNTSEFSRCIYIAPDIVSISGKLSDSDGLALKNTQVILTGGISSSTLTDKHGNYKFDDVPTGFTTRVTPSLADYTFEPRRHEFFLEANQTNLDFVGTKTKFSISGQFNYATPLSGVRVTLSGTAGRSITANSSYNFTGLNEGTYTLTPTKTGYVFSPASVDVTFANGDSNETQNFTATASSPLNGRIAFSEGGSLGSINADGSAYTSYFASTFTTSVSLSRDGKRFVYFKNQVAPIKGLFVSNADGSNEVKVLDLADTAAIPYPEWSPDGSRIAYIGPSGSLRVRTANGSIIKVNIGALTQVTSPTWLNNARLAFAAFDGNDREIYAVNIDNSGLTQLTNNTTPDDMPSASPDGTKIAFDEGTSPHIRLMVMNSVNGSGQTSIASKGGAGRSAWSPDGTRLCFVNGTGAAKTTVAASANDGSGMIVIYDGYLVSPSWGPAYEFPSNTAGVPVQAGGASVTYAGLTAGGTTTFTPISPTVAGTAPNGFVVGNQAYEISTTSVYSAPVIVCFNIPPDVSDTEFNTLSLMHNEGGVLVDRTTTRDLPARKICGDVTTLSPFVLAVKVDDTKPSITGLVQDVDGNPLSDVVVQLSGRESRTTQTDNFGIFHFVNLEEGGGYNVQPKLAGFLFDEYNKSFINLTGENAVVFLGAQNKFQIGGKVTDENGVGLSGIAISLEGSTVDTATTDSNGSYSFADLAADGAFSVTPSHASLFFTPSQINIAALTSNQSAINFVNGPPPDNQPPDAVGDGATTNQNTPVTIDVLVNDEDLDGNTLTVTSVTQGNHGNALLSGNSITYSPNAGFLGQDSFTYTISDGAGGTATGTVFVTVLQPNRPPTVVVQNISRNTDANCQASVEAQEVDGGSIEPDGDTITLTLSPAGPFGLGLHFVTLTATDNHGASASATATVTVIDNTPPSITCPQNIVVSAAPGQSSAIVNYTASATDNCGNANITSTHPSGSSFPTGVTNVTLTATDASGRTATCSFTVTVNASSNRADKIAFVATSDGNSEIYTMNANGTGLVRLTNNSSLDYSPAWSPDRSKIAFVSTRNGNPEIYVMNANGTQQTRITSHSAIEGKPSWSPNGSRIAFWSTRNGEPEIYVMNANGSNVVRLTNNSSIDIDPKWSPDGSKILFVSNRSSLFNLDLWVMNANGSNSVRLTTHESADTLPDWSPDGSKIVFTTNRGNLLDLEIWTMNANGSNQTRLTSGTRSNVGAVWSRDGANFVFTSNRDGLLNFEVYRMKANGTGQTRLTINSGLDIEPVW